MFIPLILPLLQGLLPPYPPAFSHCLLVWLGLNSQPLLLLLLPYIYPRLPFPFLSPLSCLAEITLVASNSSPFCACTFPAKRGWQNTENNPADWSFFTPSPLPSNFQHLLPLHTLSWWSCSLFPQGDRSPQKGTSTCPGTLSSRPPASLSILCLPSVTVQGWRPAGTQGQTLRCALQPSLLAHSRTALQKMSSPCATRIIKFSLTTESFPSAVKPAVTAPILNAKQNETKPKNQLWPHISLQLPSHFCAKLHEKVVYISDLSF